jgi:uncharacterized membrane protein
MRKWERVGHGLSAPCAIIRVLGIVLATSMPAAAQEVSSTTLVYATYDGEKTAKRAFQTIKENQRATGEWILAYAVVSKDANGKTHVLDQRKKGAGVGAVIGALVGVLGGPVGAAVGATAGGGLGYLTGDSVGIPREQVESMKVALTPGSSALAVVLEDRWVQDVEKGLRQANARQVIAAQLAQGRTNNPTPNNNPTPPAHP